MRYHRHLRKQHSTTALIEPLETRQLLSAATHMAISDIARGPGPGPVIPPPISIAAPNTAGQLDPSFGNGGKTTVNFGGPAVEATAVATEADGKTVEVGYASTGNGASEFAIVQLNFNGTPDTTFGPHGNGIVYLQPGSSSDESGAKAVAVDGQGRIIVAGSNNIVAAAVASVNSDMYVARYLPNGTLDPTFGKHGVADIHFGFDNASDATGIALENNGKIVVVGLNKGLANNDFGIGNVDFAIARLNSNGSLDSSFNGGGTETEGFSNVDAYANAVTIDYSGTPSTNPHYGAILVSGYTQNNGLTHPQGTVSRMAVIRLKPNGGLDSSFNGSGKFQFTPQGFSGANSTGVVVQSTGDIVFSGTLGTHNDSLGGIVGNGQFGLVRLTPSGHLDTTFANGKGFDTVQYGPTVNGDNTDYGDSLVLGPNDRLILGGSAGGNTAVLGFTANGQLDSTFGSGGIVTTSFGGNTAADGLAYLGDRIVAVGGGKFDTARYIDTSPNVAVGAFITNASPQSPVTFIVSRSQTLPYPTDVDFSIGGTAISPTDFFTVHDHTDDYTLSNFNIQLLGIAGQPFAPPSVEIPAGQSYVLVTLTPTGNVPFTGTRTATFSIIPSTFYSVASPSSLTINVLGNEAAPTTVPASADAYV